MPKRILTIEDDTFLQGLEVAELKKHNMDVSIAQNGEEGLKMVQDEKPDLVLLDLVMPNIDGFEILKILKKDGVAPNAKISILSNLDQKEDIDKGLSLGADDYIIKADFTPSEVVERAKKLLGI